MTKNILKKYSLSEVATMLVCKIAFEKIISNNVTAYNTQDKYIEANFNIMHSESVSPKLIGLIETLSQQDNAHIILDISNLKLIIRLY